MKVIVVGARGLLGQEIVEVFGRAHEVLALSRDELDVTRPEAVAELLQKEMDLLVNCAAYTKVDLAETERDMAFLVNAYAPALLNQTATMSGARFVHFSTDYVFDGESARPYTEEDPTNPQTAYGESKLAGEHALQGNFVVFRTSWLYGEHGPCFPKTVMRKLQEGAQLRVVNDQVGCPTDALWLARRVLDAVEQGIPSGIYHLCGPQAMTWYDFACHLRERHAPDAPEIIPVPSSDYPTPAKRPRYSVLDCTKINQLVKFETSE